MIASSSTGSSFSGLAGYLLGDESRVGWAESVGLCEGMNGERLDAAAAARVAAEMRDQAAESGRVRAPVYHVALSFDPDDRPTEDELRDAARRTLRDLGLDGHQAIIVRHTDQPHAHVHLMVNRVGPGGRAWSTSHERRRLRASVEAQERELGVRWTGRNAERAGVPARDAAPRDAGRGFAADVRHRALADIQKATSWSDLEARLTAHGLRVERRGRGGIVTDGKREAKLSSVSRSVSLSKLEARFGPLRAPAREERAVARSSGRVRAMGAGVASRSGRVAARSTHRGARGAVRVVRTAAADGERSADERIARAAARAARTRSVGAAAGLARTAIFPLASKTLSARATHRDVRPGGRIDRLAGLIAKRARIGRLESHWGAALGVRARAKEETATRAARLDGRARVAAEAFGRALAPVYADPKAAARAFTREANAHGTAAASKRMASTPEAFGALRETAAVRPSGLKGIFQGAGAATTDAARAAAPSAGRAGEAYVRAQVERAGSSRGSGPSGTNTWVSAAERRDARVRPELFESRPGGPAKKAAQRLDEQIGRAAQRVGRAPTARSSPERVSAASRQSKARQAARVSQKMAVRLGVTGLGVAATAVRAIGQGLGR